MSGDRYIRRTAYPKWKPQLRMWSLQYMKTHSPKPRLPSNHCCTSDFVDYIISSLSVFAALTFTTYIQSCCCFHWHVAVLVSALDLFLSRGKNPNRVGFSQKKNDSQIQSTLSRLPIIKIRPTAHACNQIIWIPPSCILLFCCAEQIMLLNGWKIERGLERSLLCKVVCLCSETLWCSICKWCIGYFYLCFWSSGALCQ